MIRLANDINGFFDRNDNNMMYISHSKYPKQNTEYIGKWTALRFKSEYNDLPPYKEYTDGSRKIVRRNGRYYYDNFRNIEVPEKDNQGNTITITEVVVNNSVNNRLVIDRRYYPNSDIKNSGRTTFFQILRYDLEEPNKVILRSKDNEIIVLTVNEFNNIYDIPGTDFYARITSSAKRQGLDYISPNTTEDLDEFFNHYRDEKINIYPLQNESILGIDIYTEFDIDIYDENLTPDDNKMSKYTTKDVFHDPVTDINNEYIYTDNMKDPVEEEAEPVTEQYNNKFNFTPRMRKNLYTANSSLKGFPDVVLQSFDATYNVHLKSKVDTPRRAINKGVIIRADIDSQEPFLVAMEYTDDGLRFICSDEGRFFFESVDMHYLHSKKYISDIISSNNIINT